MPTQPAELYKKVSEKFNVPVEQVKEIVEFFYRTGLKNDQANFVNHELYVAGLGSFEVKEFRIRHFLDHIKDDERFDNEKFEKIRENLYRIINQIDEIKKERRLFNEFYRQAPRDIPQSEKDLGRSQEQNVQEGTRRGDIQSEIGDMQGL